MYVSMDTHARTRVNSHTHTRSRACAHTHTHAHTHTATAVATCTHLGWRTPGKCLLALIDWGSPAVPCAYASWDQLLQPSRLGHGCQARAVAPLPPCTRWASRTLQPLRSPAPCAALPAPRPCHSLRPHTSPMSCGQARVAGTRAPRPGAGAVAGPLLDKLWAQMKGDAEAAGRPALLMDDIELEHWRR